jgi:SAM domain (Sterile alpha motif)
MQEITDWLTRLGLPESAGAFAENGIDVSVLPHLTEQDLKDIGVLLGHRRKILAAVAELPGKSPLDVTDCAASSLSVFVVAEPKAEKTLQRTH